MKIHFRLSIMFSCTPQYGYSYGRMFRLEDKITYLVYFVRNMCL